MNKLYATPWLIFVCCCCSVSCNQSKELVFQDKVGWISIDLSPNNPKRLVHQSGIYVGLTSSTYTDDKAISPETLTTLMESLQIKKPTKKLVIPSPDWVFYIAHNGKSSTQVMLHLTGDLDVMLDGKKHTAAFELPAGVHGFKVVRQENVIEVEHVFVPYEEPES